jgi:hypothetical protein
VGLLNSGIGHGIANALASYLSLNWAMANGVMETDNHRIDTICYPGHPTSYIPDTVAFGHPLAASHVSNLCSTTYLFISRQARHLPMFKSSMNIIRAKLFRRLRSSDLKSAGKNQAKGVFMLSRRLTQLLTATALAIAFISFAGVAGGSEAKAQGYYRNYNYNRYRQWDRRHHQRERYLWQRHRQRDRFEWRRHNRFDRYRYNNRFGRYPYRRW